MIIFRQREFSGKGLKFIYGSNKAGKSIINGGKAVSNGIGSGIDKFLDKTGISNLTSSIKKNLREKAIYKEADPEKREALRRLKNIKEIREAKPRDPKYISDYQTKRLSIKERNAAVKVKDVTTKTAKDFIKDPIETSRKVGKAAVNGAKRAVNKAPNMINEAIKGSIQSPGGAIGAGVGATTAGNVISHIPILAGVPSSVSGTTAIAKKYGTKLENKIISSHRYNTWKRNHRNKWSKSKTSRYLKELHIFKDVPK